LLVISLLDVSKVISFGYDERVDSMASKNLPRHHSTMKKTLAHTLAAAAICASFAAHGNTFSAQLNASPFGEAGRKHGVDPYLIYSIALVESAYSTGQKGTVAPYRYALRSGLGAEYPSSLEEAKNALERHINHAKSLRSIDVCLMQVNLGWNGHRVGRPEDLLDITVCLDTGAAILKEALDSTSNLYEAVGRYHTWNDRAAAAHYAVKVIKTYNNLPR
jgi:soluble lytic murein transglycosylase-like protein